MHQNIILNENLILSVKYSIKAVNSLDDDVRVSKENIYQALD